MPAVCVFCSSSEAIAERYRDLAAGVGHQIAERGWTLVSGGGSVSMMGALARAVRSAGGYTIGVIPDALLAMEVADREADELVVASDMRQRKGIMDERSDAFLALPGGIGTMEELVEAWTARSLNIHNKPVVVLDPWGDWAPLRELVRTLATSGFVAEQAVERVHWTSDISAALDIIAASHDGMPL